MDYLLRDSLFCGVRYGNYDLERLLDTIAPLEDPEAGRWGVGVEEGGVHALEALVMARYYMFTQVYFNVTSKALELHLNEWLLAEGRRWPADPRAFLAEDDVSVLTAMRRSASVHAAAVVERRHYPLAFQTREHLSAADSHRFRALIQELAAGLPAGSLLLSHSSKDSHRLGEARVLVRRQDGALEPMERASHFIGHLTAHRPVPRLLAAGAVRDAGGGDQGEVGVGTGRKGTHPLRAWARVLSCCGARHPSSLRSSQESHPRARSTPDHPHGQRRPSPFFNSDAIF